mgnify:CR=1 FL=1
MAQTQTQTLYIPRLDDKSLIKCFRQLSEEYDIPEISINVLGAGSISGIDFKEENENISFLQSQNNALIVSTSKISNFISSCNKSFVCKISESSIIFSPCLNFIME